MVKMTNLNVIQNLRNYVSGKEKNRKYFTHLINRKLLFVTIDWASVII